MLYEVITGVMLRDLITGHLILVMGPTGSGKGSIISYIREQFPEVYFSISCTTRAPRPGEEHRITSYNVCYTKLLRPAGLCLPEPENLPAPAFFRFSFIEAGRRL